MSVSASSMKRSQSAALHHQASPTGQSDSLAPRRRTDINDSDARNNPLRKSVAGLPTLSSSSRCKGFPSVAARDQEQATLASSNPKGVLVNGVVFEDVSPSMARLDAIRRSTLWLHLASEEETEWTEDAKAWASATLASLPSKRKGMPHTLPPMSSPPKTPPLKVQSKVPKLGSVQSAKGARRPSKEVPEETVARDDSREQSMLKQVAARLRTGEQGFSEPEIARLQAVFNRNRPPGSREVHKDVLQEILEGLGYMMCQEEAVRKIADEVSVYYELDFNDFCKFVESFARYEREQFKIVFDTFDEDHSGTLTRSELRNLMVSLGFTPLRAMVNEALELVDEDKSGKLDFEEVVLLLTLYRSNEGFVREEVKAIKSLFEKQAGDKGQISPGELPDFLVRYYGPRGFHLANNLGKKLMEKTKTDDSENAAPGGLGLQEALMWARLYREKEFDVFRAKFRKYDTDDSGSIDMKELQSLLQDLGFSMTQPTINEVLCEAEDQAQGPMDDSPPMSPLMRKDTKSIKGDEKLDFDEFVNLMVMLRDRSGFSKAEVAELRYAFDRFEESGDGELDSMELSDLMRYLGHVTKVADVQRLLAEVDINKNGTLEFREYLCLMRLFRQEEMREITKIFEQFKDKQTGKVPAKSHTVAMDAMGYTVPEEEVEVLPHNHPDLDFDTFVEKVGDCRQRRVKKLRRRAGFTEIECNRFQELFDKYDADKSGIIEPAEASALLSGLGFSMAAKEDREAMLQTLGKAREAADEAGIEDIGDAKSNKVTFWVLVQLLRVLYNRDDRRVLDRQERAIEQTKFSVAEVDQFREVFHTWYLQDRMFCQESSFTNPAKVSISEGDIRELSKDCIRRLLKSLNVTLNGEDRKKLDEKLDSFGNDGKTDFADFLRLMRWMLDINFGDISGSSGKRATR